MKLEIWIAIASIVVPSIIAVIGIVIQYRMSQKQIQIMLAQTKPIENVQPKEPINRPKVVLFIMYLAGSLWGVTSSVFMFIVNLPASPRLTFLALVANIGLAFYNIKNLLRVSRWPWRGYLRDAAILNESGKV